MKFVIPVPEGFNFWSTVSSHGWCELPPFHVDRDKQILRYGISLPRGKNVPVSLHSQTPSKLTIDISSLKQISDRDRTYITGTMAECLRLNEDFSEFYREAKRHNEYRWIPRLGAGRMIRGATVFEDAVKMICTTNCSWALTKIMIGNLCAKLGERIDDRHFTFPPPEAIADCSEKFLRKEIRAGYRSPYLLELSKAIARGHREIESWRTTDLPTEDLFQEVRSVKGIGPYAAGNILKLLGRYDYLAIDSWCRTRFSNLHKNGRKTNDKAIERYYASLGKWRGLFSWLELTKHWYE